MFTSEKQKKTIAIYALALMMIFGVIFGFPMISYADEVVESPSTTQVEEVSEVSVPADIDVSDTEESSSLDEVDTETAVLVATEDPAEDVSLPGEVVATEDVETAPLEDLVNIETTTENAEEAVVVEEVTESENVESGDETPEPAVEEEVVEKTEALTVGSANSVVSESKGEVELGEEIVSEESGDSSADEVLVVEEADETDVTEEISNEVDLATDTENTNTPSDTLNDEAISLENEFSSVSTNTPAPILEEEVSLEQDFLTTSDQSAVTEEVSSENEFTTETGGTNPPTPVDEEVSLENDFNTNEDGVTPTELDERVSLENNFNTESQTNPTPLDEQVSRENEFTTETGGTNPPTPVDEEVSRENEFTTETGGTNPPTPVDEQVSRENEFTTETGGGGPCTTNCPVDEEVSLENEFTTENGEGGPCTSNCPVDEEISLENEFTTETGGGPCTSDCPVDEEVSPEQDFTTESGDNGCTSNCGGGGGGGGGGGRRPSTEVLPPQCTLYLKTYMRQGYVNDSEEVRKLQLFLRVFEGFDIPVTGVYDDVTENAVRTFQNRYADDILDPWGIDENTGYAYITTTLKINYLYCGITTPITLDLRDRFPGLEIGPAGLPQLQELIDNDLIFATTTLPGPDQVEGRNIFQAAAAGLLFGFDWIIDHLCELAWLIILLLILLVLWLLYRLNQLKKELEDLKAKIASGEINVMGAGASAVGLVALSDLIEDEEKAEDLETDFIEDESWNEYAEGDEAGLGVDPLVAPLPLEEKEEEVK